MNRWGQQRVCAPGTIISSTRTHASYIIGDVLGRGGFGEVYRVVREADGQPFAMKVLLLRRARDKKTVTRAQREAQVLYELDHPNVVKVYDWGERSDGVVWMVMQLLEGWTLARIAQHVQRFPIPWALLIAKSVCAGLAAIHEYAIHRDIKPENIHVSSADGRVRLLDLGASRHFRGELLTTDKHKAHGTVPYMSPEQLIARDDTPVDQRSDIFSCGVVFYELLSGNYPFRFPQDTEEDDNNVTYLSRILFAPHVPLRDRAPWVPHTIAAAVEQCLAKKADGRLASARELAGVFATELAEFEHAHPGSLPLTALAQRLPLGEEPSPDSGEPSSSPGVVTANPFGQSDQPGAPPPSLHVPLAYATTDRSPVPVAVAVASSDAPILLPSDEVTLKPVIHGHLPLVASAPSVEAGLVMRAPRSSEEVDVGSLEDVVLFGGGDRDARLLLALKHREPIVRGTAAKLLAALRVHGAAEALKAALAAEAAEDACSAMLTAVDWAREVEPVSPRLFVERTLASALRGRRGPWVVDRAQALIGHDALAVRMAAVDVFVERGGPPAIEVLENRLLVEPSLAIQRRIDAGLTLLRAMYPVSHDRDSDPSGHAIVEIATTLTQAQPGRSRATTWSRQRVSWLVWGVALGIALGVATVIATRLFLDGR